MNQISVGNFVVQGKTFGRFPSAHKYSFKDGQKKEYESNASLGIMLPSFSNSSIEKFYISCGKGDEANDFLNSVPQECAEFPVNISLYKRGNISWDDFNSFVRRLGFQVSIDIEEFKARK